MDFLILSTQDRTQLHLPVNPERVQVTREKQIETVNILRLGEIDFPIGERSEEISFESFFPAHYDPSYCRYPDIPDPLEAIQWLDFQRELGKPVRLLITDTPINTLVLIRSLIWDFRGGEPGDIYYRLDLRGYREIKAIEQIKPGSAAATQTITTKPRPDTRPKPAKYTVVEGDSLWTIAKKFLGSGGRWQEIYEANKKTIGPDPAVLKIGTELVIP